MIPLKSAYMFRGLKSDIKSGLFFLNTPYIDHLQNQISKQIFIYYIDRFHNSVVLGSSMWLVLGCWDRASRGNLHSLCIVVLLKIRRIYRGKYHDYTTGNVIFFDNTVYKTFLPTLQLVPKNTKIKLVIRMTENMTSYF